MIAYVMTSNSYMKIIPAFLHQWEKYWGTDTRVIVCGFSAPEFDLPDFATFYSIGPQEAYPFNRWSDSLIRVLNAFPKEEVFGLFLEDYLLVQPVRRDIVNRAVDYMEQYRHVLKFDLCHDRKFAAGATEYGTLGDVGLVKSDPNSQYHASLWPGLWRRSLMLKHLLVPGESPHEIELVGTPRLARLGDEITVVGTTAEPMPLKIILGFRSQNPNAYMLDGLSAEDLAELREKGLIP